MKSLTILITSLLLLNTQSVEASDYYETKICQNCNYADAYEIAKNFEPEVKCYAPAVIDVTNPAAQECYSDINKVLVVDSVNRTIFGFNNSHTNQGQERYYLNNVITDINTIPAGVTRLANSILDTYEALNQVATELSSELTGVNAQSINPIAVAKISSDLSTTSSATSCVDTDEYKAVDAAFSSRIKSHIRWRAQEKFNSKPHLSEDFSSRRVTGASFSAGAGGIQLGGNWLIQPKSMFVYNKFRTSETGGSFSGRNQVVYSLTLGQDGLSLTLNRVQTFLGGYNIEDLSNDLTVATEISDCLGDALDKKFPKTVDGSDGSSGGSTGGTTGSTNPSFNNIPVTSDWGTGGSGGSGGCIHHYYHNGVEIFQMLGPCP